MTFTPATTPTSYDETPYPSLSYVQSHPDRLATVATLLGLSPPPVQSCRVLEVGCAGGGNIVPMAYALPGSEFVGIDTSARQIAEGQGMVEALGLDNVTLQCADILDLDPDLGVFDYIIAHGVFSWVPRTVQDGLFAVCNSRLTENGVAYVSYNTYPGWHHRQAMREMMLFHSRGTVEPMARVARARDLLTVLAEAVPADSGAHGAFLHSYRQLLEGGLGVHSARGDAFLLHDELEDDNQPVYFWQFVDRAERHGLRYLGEAEFSAMMSDDLPPDTQEWIDKAADSVVEYEQYVDFVRNRTFRQTLLCRRDVELKRVLDPDRLATLSVASHAHPTEPVDPANPGQVSTFRGTDGATLSTADPLTKAAMLHLATVWPSAVPFCDLIDLARDRLAPKAAECSCLDRSEHEKVLLGANLLRAYACSSTLVKLHTYSPALAVDVGERPVASAVARHQALDGGIVTNLRHERVRLEDTDRFLLGWLDGAHDLGRIVNAVMAQSGHDISDTDGSLVRAAVARQIRTRLEWLARSALMEG